MEKGTIGLIAGGGAALWFAFSLVASHDAERADTRASLERSNAEHDVRMAREFDAPASELDKLTKRADAAAERADVVRKESEAIIAEERGKRSDHETALEQNGKAEYTETDPSKALAALRKSKQP